MTNASVWMTKITLRAVTFTVTRTCLPAHLIEYPESMHPRVLIGTLCK